MLRAHKNLYYPMIVYALKSEGIVKALKDKASWTLGVYFDNYEVDYENSVIFGLDNPKYALEDFKFNEYSEFKKLKESYGVTMNCPVKAIQWMPVFKQSS